MLNELIFFGASLGLGALGGFLYLLFSFIFRKPSNRAAAVTVQFLLGAAVICAFTLITFLLNDGQFTFFSVATLITGFFVPQLLPFGK